MMEQVLTGRRVSFRMKVTVKALVAMSIVALAVGLPQLAHMAAGAQAGVRWLPMYLPVLLGGCLLGAGWGVGVGLAALLQPVTPFAPAVIWSQICQGWPGLVLQLLAVPCMVWGLRYFLMRDGRHD